MNTEDDFRSKEFHFYTIYLQGLVKDENTLRFLPLSNQLTEQFLMLYYDFPEWLVLYFPFMFSDLISMMSLGHTINKSNKHKSSHDSISAACLS